MLVVGAGPIGIGCAIFAGLSGASLTVADTRRDRLDFCVARLGVDHAVEPVAGGRHGGLVQRDLPRPGPAAPAHRR